MGPAILLDKSTLQSLSVAAARELRRYFHLNVPPVLVAEVLSDLSKDPNDEARCRKIVQDIARKATPPDAVVNAHYHSLCLFELLGCPQPITMDRRPIVAGARSITSADGRKGTYVGVQPENEALCRWLAGEFGEVDREFAKRWRDAIKAIDLEGYKKARATRDYQLKTLDELARLTETLLNSDEVQLALLETIMKEIRTLPEMRNWILSRWRNHDFTRLHDFAPYACHCTRANMFLYFGVPQGLIGTRDSNRIDLEYFYYTPFAWIFSSGDRIHRQLAPYMLGPDQSFVGREDLCRELNGLATLRETDPHVEPKPGSLIVSLWEKHYGMFHPQAQPRKPISKEKSEQLMQELGPIFDAMRQDEDQQPPPPRWPAL